MAETKKWNAMGKELPVETATQVNQGNLTPPETGVEKADIWIQTGVRIKRLELEMGKDGEDREGEEQGRGECEGEGQRKYRYSYEEWAGDM